MKEKHLFVYGTLRRDSANRIHPLLAGEAAYIGKSMYQGRLYRVDVYPGVVPSDNPACQVKGEVYRLRRPDLVLPKLDRYEECGPGFPAPTEYVREIQEVLSASGQKMRAWVYIYNRATESLAEIPSGDFPSHAANPPPPTCP